MSLVSLGMGVVGAKDLSKPLKNRPRPSGRARPGPQASLNRQILCIGGSEIGQCQSNPVPGTEKGNPDIPPLTSLAGGDVGMVQGTPK